MNSLERATKVIPWASQTRSKSYRRFPDNWPRFIEDANGCYVKAGRVEYLDFISALGSIILGYRNQEVDNAVKNQIIYFGNIFSLPHELETEVAEMLVELIPCAEMVYFLKNGGDATASSIRLARTISNKPVVLNRGYHGWFAFDQVTSFESIESLKTQLLNNYVAGVLIEAELFTREELQEIRNLCTEFKALLIFDEVITGFRIRIGGIQEYYGVTPDLACFSKAMANGYPISALVGKEEYMRRLEDDVFVSTTFGGDCIGLSACKATIEFIKEYDVIGYLWMMGIYLRGELDNLIKKYDFPMKLHGLPPMIHFTMPNDIHAIFLQEVIKRGIMIYNSHNLNYCHTSKEIVKLLETYDEIFPLIKKGKVKLEGNPIGHTQLFRQWRG